MYALYCMLFIKLHHRTFLPFLRKRICLITVREENSNILMDVAVV